MNSYHYNDLRIEIFDDPTYAFGSADNINKYSNHYFSDGDDIYVVSSHAVRIYRDEIEINSCILFASGGATGIYVNSTLLDNDQLLVCCCSTVFCLSIPDLELKWKVKADWATCFEIFQLEESYIVHGELEISRIDKNGHILWQFSGADIFVTANGEGPMVINKDHIALSDWGERKYKVDFNGKEF